MAGERYTEEFKIAAVKQVTENGYSIADVAKRLGITTKSLYNWRDRYGENAEEYQARQSLNEELRRLGTNRGQSKNYLLTKVFTQVN